ncbi:alpha/beta hydrolase [Nocardioides sp. HDW12B]|uniref:alpha/beta hydrolase n=1 Tax=Nocardioides sp. HDW12B TaxID=2714939 RepID=UPI001407C304|nr:alpha/beta hydrolase [Nocardioides sp. HDW12B]QIK65754.1 alpha/beta hydrolase [Nocardioides sp. HDW12B]
MSVVLLPSPLLPSSAYTGLLEALAGAAPTTDGARPAVLADPSGPTTGGELVERWSAVARDLRPDLIVAHSNAGYLAPAVRARAAPGAVVVHVDAALPPAGRRRAALAPAGFRDFAASLADDTGLLPPWTDWWPRATLEALVPGEVLPALERDCPRVPLGYLDSTVDVPDGWAAEPTAYLAFGDTYADEVAFAGAQGWPLLTREGGHLQFLWTPDRVAADVLALERRSRVAPR